MRSVKETLRLHKMWLNNDVDGKRADLWRADLEGADLEGADLVRSNLRGADLRGADLEGADLRGANLEGADLQEANLQEANLPPFQIPQEGSLTVYKKISSGLCRLIIPPEARRTACLVGRKCRAEFAVVEWLENGKGLSKFGSDAKYELGKKVVPDKYCDDIRIECSHGIHFLLTKEEAEQW